MLLARFYDRHCKKITDHHTQILPYSHMLAASCPHLRLTSSGLVSSGPFAKHRHVIVNAGHYLPHLGCP
jgi:hypothetical protein